MPDYFGDVHIKTKDQISSEVHLNFLKEELASFHLFNQNLGIDFFEDESIWTTIVVNFANNKKLFFITGIENERFVSFSSSSKTSNSFLLQNDTLNKLAQWFSNKFPDEEITVSTMDSPYLSEEILNIALRHDLDLYSEYDIFGIYCQGKKIKST